MNDNVYDEVLSRALVRVDKVSEKLAKKFKNVKPFAQEPVPKNELLSAYEGLTMDDMNLMIIKHGKESVEQFIQDMESQKMRGQTL